MVFFHSSLKTFDDYKILVYRSGSWLARMPAKQNALKVARICFCGYGSHGDAIITVKNNDNHGLKIDKKSRQL